MSKTSKKRQPPKRTTSIKIMLEILLAVATVGGFLLALLTLFPRLTISNDAAINPDDPFSTPFVISNDGYLLPLRSVEISIATRRIEFSGGEISGTADYRTRWTTPEWTVKSFAPTEKFGVYPGKIFGAQGMLINADIAIVVAYRPLLFPFRRESVFRFHTMRGPDNRLYWEQRPVSD